MTAPATSAATDAVRRRGTTAAWVAAFVLLAASGWFVLSGSDHRSGSAGVADVPGGILRIDAVGSENATHLAAAMPGMTHEPIGEGNFLLRVDATIGATDEEIRYSPEQFVITAPGLEPLEPYRAIAGPGTLFVGMTAPLLLVYEVPQDAEEFSLTYAGTTIDLASVAPPPHSVDEHDDAEG